jgi:hypothetical protein
LHIEGGTQVGGIREVGAVENDEEGRDKERVEKST